MVTTHRMSIQETAESVAAAVELVRQARKMLNESSRIIRNTGVMYQKVKSLRGLAEGLVLIEGAIKKDWVRTHEEILAVGAILAKAEAK